MTHGVPSLTWSNLWKRKTVQRNPYFQNPNEKKHSEETQTLRTGCRKAESKKFTPLQTPFPGVRDCQNLISCRWTLPLPTNPVWQGSMHAISSYRGNRSTNTPTNKQTGPITIHCTAASLVCSVMMKCTPGVEQAVGQGARMPLQISMQGARIGLCLPFFNGFTPFGQTEIR